MWDKPRAARAAAMLIEHGYTSAGFCGLREYAGEKVYPKAEQQPDR